VNYAQYTQILRENKHLPLTDQIKIEFLAKEGKSSYVIAKIMDRSINTIQKNFISDIVYKIKKCKLVKIYYATAWQARYDNNRRNCGRKYSLMKRNDFIKLSLASIL